MNGARQPSGFLLLAVCRASRRSGSAVSRTPRRISDDTPGLVVGSRVLYRNAAALPGLSLLRRPVRPYLAAQADARESDGAGAGVFRRRAGLCAGWRHRLADCAIGIVRRADEPGLRRARSDAAADLQLAAVSARARLLAIGRSVGFRARPDAGRAAARPVALGMGCRRNGRAVFTRRRRAFTVAAHERFSRG